MVNVFGGLPQQQPPAPQGGGMDDVKQAVAALMEQQQANEPKPRMPTPEEAAQLKQVASQVMQQKGQQPQQDEAVGPPRPPGMDGFGNQQPWMPGPSGEAGTGIPNPKDLPAQGSGMGDAAKYALFGPAAALLPKSQEDVEHNRNAAKLLTKLNPNTWPAEAGAAMAEKVPKVLQGVKLGANVAGDLAGTGKIFSDEPPKLKAAATPTDTSEDKVAPEEATPSEADEGEQVSRKGDVGSPEHDAHLAQVVAPEARKVADAMQAGGVNTPDKVDVSLRSSMHDDPDLEKAIKEARDTYNQMKAINNEPPSVGQYIGAILVALAGGRPEIISAILHPNQHLNAQREGMAGESLLKLQLAKASNKARANELQAKSGEDSMAQKRLDQQMSIFQQREGDTQNHQHNVEMRASLEKARDVAATDQRHFMELASKSVGTEKKRNIDLAEQARQKKEMFGGMLGEPTLDQMKQQAKPKPQTGGPQSMAPAQPQVSPAAMRLLGLGQGA